MAITDSINAARAKGASDDQIVQEIVKQNPAKAQVFQSATAKGANSKQILDEVLKQNGGQANSSATPTPNLPDNRSLLEKAGDAVNTVFPGAKIGEGIANSIAGIGDLFKGDMQGVKENADANNKIAPQIFGDAANAALTAATPLIGGGGGSAIGRIAANTALGAGLGGTNAIAEGKDVGDVAKSTAIGAGTAGVASGAAEAIGSIVNKLPTWLTKKALPKLSEGNVDYTLKNTKLGSIETLSKNSKAAVQSYESQVQGILSHPEYASETGKASEIVPNLVNNLPNAQLDPQKVVGILKQIAPENKVLVDKVVNGTATLTEQNTLRKELDVATHKAYTDKPQLTFAKSIGKAAADELRANVKNTAKETVPIFQNYSKEIDLSKALGAVAKKLQNKSSIGLYDILGGLGAGAVGGGPAGIAAGIGTHLMRSPSVDLAAAKGISAIGKAAPIVNTIGKAIKAPAIRAITK